MPATGVHTSVKLGPGRTVDVCMSLSLRAKLMLIVGAAAASLAIVIAIGVHLAWRQSKDLDELEQRLVPKLELEPRLMARFEHLGQSLKDGVAAQDRSALEATEALRSGMFALIAQAGDALEPHAAQELRDAIASYHRIALEVSFRLLDEEAGEELVLAMSSMQAEHRRTAQVIERVAKLDRGTLRSGFETLRESGSSAQRYGLGIGALSLCLVIGLSLWLGRGALHSLALITQGFARFGEGKFDRPILLGSTDELGGLAHEANRMATALERLSQERDASEWIAVGQVELSERLRGDLEPEQAARAALLYLAERVGAGAGALYLENGKGSLILTGSYGAAVDGESGPSRSFQLGEGLLGEAALQQEVQVVADLPAGYLGIRSGLGEAKPVCLVLVPLKRAERAVGVIELGLFNGCSPLARRYLGLVRESLAVAFESIKSRARLRDLLEESQLLAARLSAQEEELVQNNNELMAQQEELRLANDELATQRSSLRLRNAELEEMRSSLQEKADELSLVSSYKSQFLANMSHELRTPLNSMLLLSQILSDNESGTLTPKQVEHCRTIYAAGKGLLTVINQVLDLSKIEAGKQDLDATDVSLPEMAEQLRRTFEPQFVGKGLCLIVEVAPEVPRSLLVDGPCLQRVLINLIGNALKFTERGSVALRITPPAAGTRFRRPDLTPESCIAFAVSDTGVGIAPDARERIFARFEQADSRTVRRYGGTGLGLSIARESAVLMGGELQLESVEGQGSTFTCFIPVRALPSAVHDLPSPKPEARSEPLAEQVPDDRNNLSEEEPHLLIIEDDPVFARQLMQVMRGLRLKALVAHSGREGLRLAQLHIPAGILLDVRLPDIDGFVVREQLSADPRTASIPVHFVSGLDAPQGSLGLGAVGYLTKPASREALVDAVQSLIRPQTVGATKVLIVEDDEDQSDSVLELLRQSNLEGRQAHTADEALRSLASERFGCVILDLGLPDADGLRLLEDLQTRTDIWLPPIVVHTARALSREATRQISDYAETVVLKDGRSAERLVSEVQRFVGQVRGNLPRRELARAEAPPLPDAALEGVTVLIADDDMRTVYALSALLRGRGADVVVAETGREALRLLEQHPNVRAVLMDIMMPEMDGYEAMRRLREQPRFAELPVIALTARAMKGERERCQAAGASEYMAKPVDPAGLVSILKHCLARPLAEGIAS